MKNITLECDECHKKFNRRFATYKYRCKKGVNKKFCSIKCSGIHSMKNVPKDFFKNRYENSKHKWNIANLSSNRKDEFSPFKSFITTCKNRKKQQLDINTTYLKQLWEKQNGICPYTGLKMILPKTTQEYAEIHSLKKASLDRIDSSRGYVKENVEFVCIFINFAKNNYSKQDVVSLLREIKNGRDGEI